MANQYNLTTLPEYTRIIFNRGIHDAATGKRIPDEQADKLVKWSGKHPVPVIGAKVKVELNGLGLGVVVGYFVEHEWLGVEVKLDKPPRSYLKRFPDAIAMAFGAELEEKVCGYPGMVTGVEWCIQPIGHDSEGHLCMPYTPNNIRHGMERERRRLDAKRNRPRSRRAEREGGR